MVEVLQSPVRAGGRVLLGYPRGVRTLLCSLHATWLPGVALASDPETPAAILQWEAPQECPTEADVAASIARLLPPSAQGDTTTRVRATVERTMGSPRFRLTLDTAYAGATERHVIASEECGELAASVAMVVGALALRGATPVPGEASALVPQSPRAASRGGPTGQAQPQLVVTAQAEPPAARRRYRRRWAPSVLGVGAALGVDVGSIEVPAALAEVAIGPAWTRVRLEATARLVLPRSVSQGDFTGVFWQWALAPRACLRGLVRRVELPICAALELGQVHGSRQAPASAPSRAGSHLWVAPVLGAGVIWMGRRVGVRAAVEGGVRLVGSDFEANGVEVLSPWLLSFRAALGFFFDLNPNFAGLRTSRTRP